LLGERSWYAFARTIFEFDKLIVDLKPVGTSEFPALCGAPPYSVLSEQKASRLGINVPRWEEGLGRYLAARRDARAAVNTVVR
jgi:dTDP-4-dehydrorhamnose reductase